MDIKILSDEVGKRVDVFLSNKFKNTPLSAIQRLIRKKLVRVNGGRVDSNYRLNRSDIVNIVDFIYKNLTEGEKSSDVKSKNNERNKKKSSNSISISTSQIKEFKKTIIYEDENILAINKPFGLHVQGGSKVSVSVNDYIDFINKNEGKTLKLVHRLDRDTTGVLVIAKNAKASDKLTELFKNKKGIQKTYLALVIGLPTNTSDTINMPLLKKYQNGVEKVYRDDANGKEAITKYNVLGYSKKYNISVVEIQILTGRTHQIRVHMKEIGHPVLGDGKYGGKKAFVSGFDDKLHLHALRLDIAGVKLKAKLSKHIENSIEKLNVPTILK